MLTASLALMGRFLDRLSLYDTNVMHAAVISLLVVILFVLLLHLFAKWFLSRTNHRRVPAASFVGSSRLAPARRYHSFSSTASKGLEAAIIASIPLFAYRAREFQSLEAEECVICLTAFEENEACRRLSKCQHSFHVECIDMWLRSHSDCPVCRALATGNRIEAGKIPEIEGTTGPGEAVFESVMINSDPRVPSYAVHSSSEIRSSTASSPSSSSNSLGSTLKRMLSRNRSETKLFPSASFVDE